MRIRLLALLFLLAVLGLAHPARAGVTATVDDSWMQQYYQRPQPERFAAEVEKYQRAGVLKNQNALAPSAAFFSRLFRAAPPGQLAEWLKVVDRLAEDEQSLFFAALRWADTPATREALAARAAKPGKAGTSAKEFLDSPIPDLDKLTDPTPGDLDMCWGAFFASGDPAYVLTVIRCAVRPVKKDVLDLTRAAAQWSLKSLCETHKKVKEIEEAFYKTATAEERKILDEVFKK